MLDEVTLEGKVAIVIASGQSLAGALAQYLHRAGAQTIVAIDDRDEIKQANATLPVEDIPVYPTDLTREEDIVRVVEQVVAKFGKIDILVNNLNLELWKPLLEITSDDWQLLMQINVATAFLTCKAVGKYLVSQKQGSVVNVISALAERGVATGTAYCASMGAVLELTRSLALEWAPLNVRVNAVSVGWPERTIPLEGKDIVKRYIPAQRRTRPEDVSPLVAFLASDAASFLNGCIYTVDGGLMARA